MGQSAGGILQGGFPSTAPGGTPSGYQPPGPATLKAVSSGVRMFDDNGVWTSDRAPKEPQPPRRFSDPDASRASAGLDPSGSGMKGVGYADRLNSFSTDVDAGSNHGGFARGGSFATDVNAACNAFSRGSPGDRGGPPVGGGFNRLPYPPAHTVPYGSQGSDYARTNYGLHDPLGSHVSCGADHFNSNNGGGLGNAHRLDGGGGAFSSYQSSRPPPFHFGEPANNLASHSSSAFASVSGGGEGDPVAREDWEVGSVLEVYAKSVGRWFPALLTQVEMSPDGAEILTAQFSSDDGLKIKSVYRNDAAFAVFGTNVKNELPPGFRTRPSASRAGQMTYVDATTGTKYASLYLAWHVHLDRLLRQPEVGLETVVSVKGAPASSSMASNRAYGASPIGSCGGRPLGTAALQARQPLSLSELQSHDFGGTDHERDSQPRNLASAAAAAAAAAAANSGKVALPCFNGLEVSNQAAYLGYIGAVGQQSQNLVGDYQTPQNARALPVAMRPPVRARDPSLQVWEEDPFSQWRR